MNTWRKQVGEMSLTDEIRGVLSAAPQNGMTSKDVAFHCSSAPDITAVCGALYAMRERGEIERDDEKRYRLTGVETSRKQKKQKEPERQEPAIEARPPISAPPAAAAADPVLDILLDAERAAQDALDRYVWLVGDRAVLESLMAQRNAARAIVRTRQGLPDEA